MVSKREIANERKEIEAANDKAQKQKDRLGFKAGVLLRLMQDAYPISKRLEAIEESKALGVERAKVNEDIEALKRRSNRLDQLEQEETQKCEARAQEDARQIQLATRQAEQLSL
ncbi:hypothetical protein BDZ45DRAFT_683861 [Acephala macrosclerotiorum]|nr:hypothetical protein BDZ45DRAFT_683861 [Acephala macrosclerotiorum]